MEKKRRLVGGIWRVLGIQDIHRKEEERFEVRLLR